MKRVLYTKRSGKDGARFIFRLGEFIGGAVAVADSERDRARPSCLPNEEVLTDKSIQFSVATSGSTETPAVPPFTILPTPDSPVFSMQLQSSLQQLSTTYEHERVP